MNLLIFRVRGQKSRPSFTLKSMEIIVNVMNSELLSLFGSHLAHIVSVAHDERSKLENGHSLFRLKVKVMGK